MKKLLILPLFFLFSCESGTLISEDLKQIIEKEKIESVSIHLMECQNEQEIRSFKEFSFDRNYLKAEGENYNLGNLVKYKVEGKGLRVYF